MQEPLKEHDPDAPARSPWRKRLHHWRTMLKPSRLALPRPRVQWDSWAEWGLIVAWALFVGRSYLNFDPNLWPWGLEFGHAVQSHFIWTLLSRCGSCAFWNGFLNGGAPAFVELHGAPLHPAVMIPTLLWGVINGAKVTLLLSLAMAGLAQWWLAKVLRLGLVARLWSAGVAVVGGHLAGRMDAGVYAVVLSTAAASLALAPALDLALHGNRRATVWLGVTLALAIVAGQGYLQLGLILVLPTMVLFLFDENWRIRPIWREFLLAGLLAILLAGILLVPLLHFWPQLGKHRDPNFSSTQPIEYAPLNLLIHDGDFYRTEWLEKQPYPYLYVSYIGWVPLLLALSAFRLVPRPTPRLLYFFVVSIALVFLASSSAALRFLPSFLSDLLAGVQNPPLIAGLAVPLILATAAWGLDLLLKLKWPRLTTDPSSERKWTVSLAWVVLPLPLAWAILSAYYFSASWLKLAEQDPTHRLVIQELTQPETAQWVRPPFGEHYWIPLALEADLKVTSTYRPWFWEGREFPPIYLEATRNPVDPSTPTFLGQVAGINFLLHPENEYAYLDTDLGQIPCRATATGGNIDVDCQSTLPGRLIVLENNWSGWRAKRDGTRVDLGPGQWLSVEAPAGKHHYEFRYRPWDVSIGLLASLGGIGWAIWLWVKRREPAQSATRSGRGKGSAE